MNTALSTTTTKVTVFQNRQFGEVRTIMRNGEPWFVAADVCRALEINNSRDAVTRLEDDERVTVVLTDGIRGNSHLLPLIERNEEKTASDVLDTLD